MQQKLILIAFFLMAGIRPAQADLSYDYVELRGIPVVNSIPIPVKFVIGFDEFKRTVEFDGWGVGTMASFSFRDHWYAFLEYDYRESRSSNV